MKTVSKSKYFVSIMFVLIMILSSACAKSKVTGTLRVSVATDESQANNRSKQPSISDDGRYIAFTSEASNLVDNDLNRVMDVFVRDTEKGTTTRVSVSSLGIEGNQASYWPFISSDGRFVTFTSEADNLVDRDTNGVGDVFVHDMESGKTELVSITSGGQSGNDLSFWSSVSTDGRYVAFMSQAVDLVETDNNDTWDIFLRDRTNGTTSIISNGYDGKQANSQSEYPQISADGRYIAFASDATNIVQGDTNGYRDLFEYDRLTKKAIRASVASDGTQTDNGTQVFSIDLSSDGRYIAFSSLATNLVKDDTNKVWDIFVHDRNSGDTARVSVSSDDQQSDAGSYGVSISPDGRYVTFGSNATNLVPGDTNDLMDVFVHDRRTGQTRRISISTDGTQGNGSSGFFLVVTNGTDISYGPLLTSDGSTVVFMSNASNLVEGDTNSAQDIYINSR